MKKVLIIEDNEDISTILKKKLQKTGFSVEVADSGFSVLSRLKNAPEPDIVILDIILPQRSGVELLCSLKSVWNMCKVYIFSGHEEYREKEMLKEYISGFFLKSEGMNKLIEALKPYL